MKAKVTLTCDLDEASSMVVDILRRATSELRALSDKKFNHWQVNELLMQIGECRAELERIDNMFNDASNIASGWLEVMYGVVSNSAEEFSTTKQEDMNEQEGEV